jgi:hypothetical protein
VFVEGPLSPDDLGANVTEGCVAGPGSRNVWLYRSEQDWLGAVTAGPIVEDPHLLAAVVDALATEAYCVSR